MTDPLDEAFNAFKRALPGSFICAFVFQNCEVDGEEGILAMLKTNVEDPRFMFEQIRSMVKSIEDGNIPVWDMRKSGGLQ